MSFVGIGIYAAQKDCNLGTLFRSAYAFGASLMYTIGGKKYRRQPGDTPNSTKHVPYIHFSNYDDFKRHRPNAHLIIIELDAMAISLYNYTPPKGPVLYLLGSEGGGLPQELLRGNIVVQIPTKTCLNVSCAGTVLLAHHNMKVGKAL